MKQDELIKVYKASAGSGKTYTLTHEYINLILNDEDAYKHVLAVTFTNKATDEMKGRILEELYRMASDIQCPEREMARKVLIKILHDYPAFSVSTIDRFFQGVMRAFARELGRMITYGVELDAELVRNSAVDNLFADLDRDENKFLLKWLVDYSLERVENGESWRIANDILKLSKSLFSESFKLKSGGAKVTVGEQMERIVKLKAKIGEIVSCFEQERIAIGKEAVGIMGRCGIDYTYYKGGERSSLFKIFYQNSNGEKLGEAPKPAFIAAHNNVELWYTKTKKKDIPMIEQSYSAGLNDCVGKLIDLYKNKGRDYYTALCVRGNLNSLGILGYVYAYILDYCKEKNVVLLSETTELLGKIIDGDDTPFIYEKVGTWINNFMLDEFQDTSMMQWRNFIPLLSNSVGNNDQNLIVGDIKQSIYRFRNSDWNILKSGIDNEFKRGVSHKHLDVNWRSAENIVEFNNCFFEAAAKTARDVYGPDETSDENTFGRGDQIVEVYSNFAQRLPEKRVDKGYVNINFVNKKTLQEVGADYDLTMQTIILNHVSRLVANGYRQSDIGILVRWNSEGAAVAKSLIAAGYNVISADSLSVSSSAAVLKVVNILKWLDDPDNVASEIYAALSVGEVASDIISPEESSRLKSLSTYQMCEEIIRCYLTDRQKEDIAFLQAFLDMVMDFSVNQGSNLSAFLKWWDENGMKKSVSSPEDMDAIQVMTVHKAKGLAFEAVIVPYFSNMLDHSPYRAPLLWSSAASQLLEYPGPLPVKYSPLLKETLFSGDYHQEKLEVFMDNLNVAYVAFTRPKRELVVIAEEPVENKDGVLPMHNVSALLYDYMESVPEICGSEFEEYGDVVEVGGISVPTLVYTLGEEEPFVGTKKENLQLFGLDRQFVRGLDMARVRTAMQSGSINDELTLRDNGIIMHDLFASINIARDVDRLPDGQVKEQIREVIASVADRGWFSDEYDVFRECSIILPDGSVLRPDRVLVKGSQAIVIDYKFGEFVPDNRQYHRQVRRYMQLLSDMGYETVTGYLWYVKEAAVEQVVLG